MLGGAGRWASLYSFRNRFRLQEGDRIAIDAHEYPLAGSVADGNVVLMAAGRDTIISKTTVEDAVSAQAAMRAREAARYREMRRR